MANLVTECESSNSLRHHETIPAERDDSSVETLVTHASTAQLTWPGQTHGPLVEVSECEQVRKTVTVTLDLRESVEKCLQTQSL